MKLHLESEAELPIRHGGAAAPPIAGGKPLVHLSCFSGMWSRGAETLHPSLWRHYIQHRFWEMDVRAKANGPVGESSPAQQMPTASGNNHWPI